VIQSTNAIRWLFHQVLCDFVYEHHSMASSSGVGVALACATVSMKGEKRPMVTVKAIDAQGLAASSELLVGDMILQIHGKDASSLDLLFKALIRSGKGQLRLQVQTPGVGSAPREVAVERSHPPGTCGETPRGFLELAGHVNLEAPQAQKAQQAQQETQQDKTNWLEMLDTCQLRCIDIERALMAALKERSLAAHARTAETPVEIAQVDEVVIVEVARATLTTELSLLKDKLDKASRQVECAEHDMLLMRRKMAVMQEDCKSDKLLKWVSLDHLSEVSLS